MVNLHRASATSIATSIGIHCDAWEWEGGNLFPSITSNCRQIWHLDQPMSLIVSSIVGGVNEQNSIVNKCLCK